VLLPPCSEMPKHISRTDKPVVFRRFFHEKHSFTSKQYSQDAVTAMVN
jgi:hypothetical protein